MNLNAERFRQLMRRPGRGEPVLWEKALDGGTEDPANNNYVRGVAGLTDGFVYVPQTLDSAVRVVFGSSRSQMMVREWGILPANSTFVVVMPDEIALSKFDRLTRTTNVLMASTPMTRGSGSSDILPTLNVQAVANVNQQGTQYVQGAEGDYVLTGNSIVWASGHGPAEGSIYAVRYTYNPVYICLGAVGHESFLDLNNVPLPAQWDVELYKPEQPNTVA